MGAKHAAPVAEAFVVISRKTKPFFRGLAGHSGDPRLLRRGLVDQPVQFEFALAPAFRGVAPVLGAPVCDPQLFKMPMNKPLFATNL